MADELDWRAAIVALVAMVWFGLKLSDLLFGGEHD
jgi:hypothetical protein